MNQHPATATRWWNRPVNVRGRLGRDVAWMSGIGVAISQVLLATVGPWSWGWDAHAYWLAWRGPLYEQAPNTADAFLYSPLFAQLIWPLTHLPWPLFAGLMSILSASLLGWLLAPLGWQWAVPLWLMGFVEIVSGNIFVLLAVCAVFGFRRPGVWAFSALTKITTTMGVPWFALRGEWHKALVACGVTVAVCVPSVIATPELWVQWIHFLAHNLGGTAHPTAAFFPPFVWRAPFGVLALIWGARTNRRWTVPVSMLLCTPTFGIACFTLLAAIPRIVMDQRRESRLPPNGGVSGPLNAHTLVDSQDPSGSEIGR